jgi:hypothetical protein
MCLIHRKYTIGVTNLFDPPADLTRYESLTCPYSPHPNARSAPESANKRELLKKCRELTTRIKGAMFSKFSIKVTRPRKKN